MLRAKFGITLQTPVYVLVAERAQMHALKNRKFYDNEIMTSRSKVIVYSFMVISDYQQDLKLTSLAYLAVYLSAFILTLATWVWSTSARINLVRK